MHRFILFAILFITHPVFSQHQCHCDEYDISKKHNEPDSLIAPKLLAHTSLICQAKGAEIMGDLLTDALRHEEAAAYLTRAEELYRQSGCPDTVLLLTYQTWAQLYYNQADFAKAQVYSLKMLNCAEASGNPYQLAKGNTMVAQLFNQTNQAEKGIIYTRRAAKLLPQLHENEQYSIVPLLFNRYLWHYQDTRVQSSLDTAAFFAKQYLNRSKLKKDNEQIALAFNALQGIAFEQGEFRNALTMLDSARQYINKDSYETLRLHYFDRADILVELHDYPLAKAYADSALRYALLRYRPAYVVESYELLERIATLNGDYKTAYQMCRMQTAMNDSIHTVERTKAVTELEKKYNQAKNEHLIQDLDRKKQIYRLLALAGLLASIAAGFFFRQQKFKHRQDILETEQRLNRARMNPHFFFNALTALQKYALGDHDGKALASNLSKFSNIMRETLESTYKEYITVEQEIDFLSEYLEVQKIRFPKTFKYEVAANPDMEIDDILIPSMILQPFVENSIEHGFAGIDYPGHIQVFFEVVDKEILITIIDNGKGLMTTYKEDNQHISRASQIIKDRIYLLNIKLKTKAGFRIDNNADGTGAVVHIHLPLLYKNNLA